MEEIFEIAYCNPDRKQELILFSELAPLAMCNAIPAWRFKMILANPVIQLLNILRLR